VNLVFIRLMRDLVEHYRARLPGAEAGILDDTDQPLREEYLDRFADREGASFLRRFYREHHGENADQLLGSLTASMSPVPKRIAAIYRSTRPAAPFEAFDRFLLVSLPAGAVDEGDARTLYDQLSPERMSLSDRGYVARVHPLELWVVEYLARHPDASLSEVLDSSVDARQEVYSWLRRTGHKNAQDRRIRTLLESEAFVEIHRAGAASAIRSNRWCPPTPPRSAAPPIARRRSPELLGILVNDGVRLSTERLARFHFGASTPFETVLEREPAPSERVLHSEVATVVRHELLGVVRSGTAARARKTIELADGRKLDVGGKTGPVTTASSVRASRHALGRDEPHRLVRVHRRATASTAPSSSTSPARPRPTTASPARPRCRCSTTCCPRSSRCSSARRAQRVEACSVPEPSAPADRRPLAPDRGLGDRQGPSAHAGEPVVPGARTRWFVSLCCSRRSRRRDRPRLSTVDRAAPREDGEPAHGLPLPDPGVATGCAPATGPAGCALPYPDSVAVLTGGSAQMLPWCAAACAARPRARN
jgi:hypothetical protein